MLKQKYSKRLFKAFRASPEPCYALFSNVTVLYLTIKTNVLQRFSSYWFPLLMVAAVDKTPEIRYVEVVIRTE